MTVEFLRKYKGKTVDEVLLVIEEEEKTQKEKYEDVKKQKREFVDSLLKQKYFYVDFNVTSVGYFKLESCNDNWELHSEFISILKDGTIQTERKRFVNVLWFGESAFGNYPNKTTPITKEEYLSVKTKIENFILQQFRK